MNKIGGKGVGRPDRGTAGWSVRELFDESNRMVGRSVGRNCTVPDLVGSTSMLSLAGSVGQQSANVENECGKGPRSCVVHLRYSLEDHQHERSAEPEKGLGRGECECDTVLWWHWRCLRCLARCC